jgi:hypothetical protein
MAVMPAHITTHANADANILEFISDPLFRFPAGCEGLIIVPRCIRTAAMRVNRATQLRISRFVAPGTRLVAVLCASRRSAATA